MTGTDEPTTRLDYFQRLFASTQKLEFVGGYVREMGGAQPNRNRACRNLYGSLVSRCRERGLEFFASDQGLVTPKGDIFFPDGSIAENATFEKHEGLGVLTNPIVLFEVLSPHTAGYDFTTKLRSYQSIPTVCKYCIIDPERIGLTVFRRTNAGWTVQTIGPEEKVPTLSSIRLELSVAKLYDRVPDA